jgi:small GTP-binding protein
MNDDNDKKNALLKNIDLAHFKKVNLIGGPNVGKKTLLSYLKRYMCDSYNFKMSEKTETEEEISNMNKNLVDSITRISLKFNENDILNMNLYLTTIRDIDFIKDNIDTLFHYSECVLFMFDITSIDSFQLIYDIIALVNEKMQSNMEFGNVPIFFISNKLDLDQNREVSGFEIKELSDNYKNTYSYEISLKLEENASDQNINDFILKLCDTISEKTKKYSYKYDYLNLVKIKEPMPIPDKFSQILDFTDCFLTLILLGSQTVGKTSFINKIFNNTFMDTTISTLGMDVMRTVGELYGRLVKIELWDTAGQERLRSIPKQLYSKGDGFFLLFDVCDQNSFEDISGWIKDVRQARTSADEKDFEKKPIDENLVLIGNKIDKVKERVVTKDQAIALAKKFNLDYYEMSCKQGINVYEVFSYVVFNGSSMNRRDSTNIILQRRKTKIQSLYHPKKKKCC